MQDFLIWSTTEFWNSLPLSALFSMQKPREPQKAAVNQVAKLEKIGIFGGPYKSPGLIKRQILVQLEQLTGPVL